MRTGKILFFGYWFFCLGCLSSAQMWAQCINALIVDRGWVPGTAVNYVCVGTWDDINKSAVEDALAAWSIANIDSGLNVTFGPAQQGQSANLTLFMTSTHLASNEAAGIVEPQRDSNGYLTGCGIAFNTNTSILSNYTGFLKATLHEGGHTHGLADMYGTNGSTVVNQFSGGGPNDPAGNVPTSVTSCDQGQAARASPPPPGSTMCDAGARMDCRDSGHTWNSATCTCNFTPVLIDTSGNDFVFTDPNQGVNFDLNADGIAERISWTAVGSDDAFLALDRNGNGKIDDGTELFGDVTPQPTSGKPNGFLALAVLDATTAGGNADGLISSADQIFSLLRLWIDANHDGISQAQELHSLSTFGIAALELDYKYAFRRDRHGNLFRFRSKVHMQRGERFAYDVVLLTQ